MTTVTSGDKRIDKYDDEKRQDGDYLLTKVNKTNVFSTAGALVVVTV